MSEKFEVIAIQSAQQSMLSFTDEAGVRWVSLPDVIAALLDVDAVKTAGLQRMQTQMLQNIEYELRQQGNRECQYKEWLERGHPITVCFVNARGANRATMKTEGPKAAALRTELLDKLEEKENAIVADTSVTAMIRQNAETMLMMAEALDQKVDRAEFHEKLAELQYANAAENRQQARTARQHIGMERLAKPTTENGTKLGKACRSVFIKKHGKEPKGIVPQIWEGTIEVYMWPLEILREGAKLVKWK